MNNLRRRVVKKVSKRDIETFEIDVGTIVSDRSRRLYGFEIIAYDRPGVAARISEIFARYNVNIVKIVNSLSDDEGKVLVYVVGDFSKARVTPDKLMNQLVRENKDYVLEVYKAPRLGSIIYSDKIFPLKIGDYRVVSWGPANLRGFLIDLKKTLGDEVACTILFHLGEAVGRATYESYISPIDSNLEIAVDVIRGLMIAYGWGKILEYEINEYIRRMVISVDRLWECELMEGKVDKPASVYFKGFLSGFFSKHFNRRVIVREIECVAKGDKQCTFEITW